MADRLHDMPAQVGKFLVHKFATITALVFVFAITACVPKETAIPSTATSTSSPGYAGFTGALSAQTMSGSKIKVTWAQSTDASVAAYNIYDATFLFSPKLLKTVTAPANSVTLTNLTAGTYFRIRVRAADSKGKEDANTVDLPAITYAGATAAVVQGSTSAYLQYTDASNADQLNVYCNQGGTTTDTLVASVHNVALTQTLLTGLVAGQQYNCRAALVINGFVDNNTNYITFTPLGTASALVFTTQPGSATAGVNLSPQPVVTIQDVNGNTVSAGPDATAVITLSVSTNSPTLGTVRGNFSVAAKAGVATFSGINLQEAGLKILTASKGDSSGLAFGSPAITGDSGSFTISPDAVSPAKSLIAVTPTGPLIANGTSAYTVSMKLQDQYGNAVSGVTPRFASTNSSDILTQSLQSTDASGVATGSISTTVVGGILNNGLRTLSISSPSGLSAVTTAATFIPGPATQLAFTQQPVTSPAGSGGMTSDVIVTVEDANGNTVASTDGAAMTPIDIALSAAPGGGVLLGTTEVTAINGVADFAGLGIDKIGNNYKMKAYANAYPTLTQPNSNPFNITSASPTKIAWTAGATSLVSSTTGSTTTVCGTYTITLEDGGNNASNATTNMTLNLSSTQAVGGASGSALFYNSSNCSGSAVTSVTVTTGRSTATVSMRDPAAETINLSVASTGVSAGTYTVAVAPAQFVLSGGPINTLSGACSSAFTLTTQGANSSTGPVPADTAFTFSFLNSGASTNAVAYKDSACSVSLGASPASVTVGAGTSSAKIYFKDLTAEGPVTVALSAQNNMISATTSPSNQAVTFLGSKLSITSPNLPIIAGGACVGPFPVKVQDAAGNTVTTASNTLNINGQTGTTKFYTSASCATPVTNFTVVNGVANLYIADTAVETLSISIADPTAAPLTMATSSTLTIQTSPYQLAWTTPSTSTSQITTGPIKDTNPDTTICQKMVVASQYSSGTNVAPLSAVTVTLGGAGTYASTGANFYSDSLCTTPITSTTLSGSATATVYFQSLSPGSFTLTASDAANVIATSTAVTTTVVTDKAWIGSRVGGPTVSNNFAFTFGTGQGVGQGRTDGPLGTSAVHFDPTKQYLFVADFSGHRVFKYDYLNNKYLGWIGGFYTNGGNANYAPITGGASGCLSVTNNQQQMPGWCTGGTAQAAQPQTTGSMYGPIAMADDGYNLYVANYSGSSVTMYNMSTGAYEGWIGTLYSTTTPGVVGGPTSYGPATAASSTNPSGALLSNTCSSSNTLEAATPGFCTGGNNDNQSGNIANRGSGQLYNPRTMIWANNRLYVGSNGQINMYDATPGAPTQGQFLGWIGWMDTTYVATSCTGGTPTGNAQTPGWCTGGRSNNKTPSASGGINAPTGLYADVTNDWLYVVDSNRISRYHLTSGAFESLRLATGTVSPQAMVSDGANMYVADWSRILLADTTASSQVGWVGKVTSPVPTAPAACSSLNPYANTPGWCSNGTSLSGLDEAALVTATSIELDGQGNLITGQRYWPAIKKWNASTGVYLGQMVLDSQSPSTWTTTREYATNGGFDDLSLNYPMGSVVDKTNNLIYVVELGTSRIKKISTITGQTLGWIGGITTIPTGGDAACTQLGVSAMAASPGWCKGSFPNAKFLWDNSISLMAQTTPGTLYAPAGIAMDSTYLYVTDLNRHRVDRFVTSTGVYAGWIGYISSTPIGGDSGCTSAASGFTPGWCIGGQSTSSTLDGGMNYPTGITVQGGYLYVLDFRNDRVNKYLASSGAFQGWVGQMGTNTASCTTATRSSTTYTKGWCKASTAANSSLSARAVNNGDPGGGFAWYTNSQNSYPTIDSDATYFYVSQEWENRIDKFWLAAGTVGGVSHVAGEWAGSLNIQYTLPLPTSNTWTTSPGAWGDYYWSSPTYIYPSGIHIDSANDRLYYVSDGNAVVMRKLSDGSFIGWQGGITSGNLPSLCTPSGTLAGFTPGWCQGGAAQGGYTYGQFSWGAYYLSGDSNYVYVTDINTHRVTRIPKRVN